MQNDLLKRVSVMTKSRDRSSGISPSSSSNKGDDLIPHLDRTYNNSTGNTRILTGIAHLLFVWKGSVYKLIWVDFLLFAFGYALLSILYRTILFPHPVPREIFEIMCVYANKFGGLIPISFLTGFYVSQVVSRWWDQFISLPWPEKIAYKLLAFIPGKDKFRLSLRRTVMRYVNLSNILSYRMVSSKIRERFPTYSSLVEAKLLHSHEVEQLRRTELAADPYEFSSIPIVWAHRLLRRAKDDNRIEMDSMTFGPLVAAFDYQQDCNRKMLAYGWMKFPLAYTQIAKWAVDIYFVSCLFGRQYLTPRAEGNDHTMFPDINISYSSTQPFINHTPDLYVPVFTFVELLCYVGWIKVADAMLNPFGDDDQDFQINYLIDRNLKVSYLIVDDGVKEEFDLVDRFMERADRHAEKEKEEREDSKHSKRQRSSSERGWDEQEYVTEL